MRNLLIQQVILLMIISPAYALTLTTGTVTKAISTGSIGDSQIYDDGTNVGVGSATPGAKLDVAGTVRVQDLNWTDTDILKQSNSGINWTDAHYLCVSDSGVLSSDADGSCP